MNTSVRFHKHKKYEFKDKKLDKCAGTNISPMYIIVEQQPLKRLLKPLSVGELIISPVDGSTKPPSKTAINPSAHNWLIIKLFRKTKHSFLTIDLKYLGPEVVKQ